MRQSAFFQHTTHLCLHPNPPHLLIRQPLKWDYRQSAEIQHLQAGDVVLIF